MSRKLLGVLGMRLFTIFRWLVVVLCIITAAAIVYAESTGKDVVPVTATTIIDNNSTAVSIGMVVTLVGIAVTLVASMNTSKNHIANEDIHNPSGVIAAKYAEKTDCAAKHQAVDHNFERLFGKLDEFGKDLSYIRGKFDERGN